MWMDGGGRIVEGEKDLEKPEYFECRCSTNEHALKFWFDDDPDEPCVYASVFLAELPFLRRFWAGLRYILGGKCRYGHFEEFILRPEDRDRLIGVVKKLKIKHKKSTKTGS